MSTTEPSAATKPEELLRVAQEYADLFNATTLDDVDRLIADACVDPFWDDRTNLLSLLADGPDTLALVLATAPEDYVVVRYADGWEVDTCPVDWEALEDQAFDLEADEADDDTEAEDDDEFDGSSA
jgi:hypothetical protein